MADETTAAIEDDGVEPQEADATETESEDVQASAEEVDEVDEPEESGEDDEDEHEEIEFDFGGEKLRVPKGTIPDDLAERIDQFTKGTWSDYTRKSQDVAERAKSLEARESAVQKMESLHDDVLSTYLKGIAVRQEIERLSQADLNALWQSNPDQARRISDHLSQKRRELNAIANDLAQKEQGLYQAEQSELARRAGEGKQRLERRIKGFSEKLPEMVDYMVTNYGYDREGLAQKAFYNPAFSETAYKAMLYDRMQAKAKGKPSQKQPASQPVKPMKAAGKARRNYDLVRDADKFSSDEWARRRNAEIAKRRGG